MSAPEESFSDADQQAFAFCVRLLEEDADLSYKEVRREARVREGLGLRRQVWTAARRKLGLISESEGEEFEAPPRPRPAVSDASDDRAATPPERGERSDRGGRRERRQQWRTDERDHDTPRDEGRGQREEGRGHRDDGRSHREERPEPRPAGPERIPAWRQSARPAWATPRDEDRPAPPPLVNPRPNAPFGAPPTPPPSAPLPSFGAPSMTPSPLGGGGGSPTSAIEWMVEYLKTINANATFAEIRLAAERAGHQVYPATFGRAQAIAGLLDEQERKAREAPKPAAPAVPVPAPAPAPTAAPAAPAAQEPPAPRTTAKPGVIDPVEGLKAFQAALERAESGRAEMRELMGRMLEVVGRALDPAAASDSEA